MQKKVAAAHILFGQNTPAIYSLTKPSSSSYPFWPKRTSSSSILWPKYGSSSTPPNLNRSSTSSHLPHAKLRPATCSTLPPRPVFLHQDWQHNHRAPGGTGPIPPLFLSLSSARNCIVIYVSICTNRHKNKNSERNLYLGQLLMLEWRKKHKQRYHLVYGCFCLEINKTQIFLHAPSKISCGPWCIPELPKYAIKCEAADISFVIIPNQYKDIYRIIDKYIRESSKIAH